MNTSISFRGYCSALTAIAALLQSQCRAVQQLVLTAFDLCYAGNGDGDCEDDDRGDNSDSDDDNGDDGDDCNIDDYSDYDGDDYVCDDDDSDNYCCDNYDSDDDDDDDDDDTINDSAAAALGSLIAVTCSVFRCYTVLRWWEYRVISFRI